MAQPTILKAIAALEPDERRSEDRATRRPSSLGYVRVSPTTSDVEIERLRRALATHADRLKFAQPRVLVDHSPLHTTAFAELIHAVSTGAATNVLIPALHHLAYFPGIQLAMKELLEAEGARVFITYPSTGEAL